MKGGVSPPVDGYPEFVANCESYDGVVIIEAGAHPLACEGGTHSAVVRVFRGVASHHVMGLEVCLDDNFAFEVHRPITARRSRPLLRGHVNANGERIQIGARARDDHERSFDLYAGVGRDLTIIGSLRLGQRVVLEAGAAREPWAFGLSRAAA